MGFFFKTWNRRRFVEAGLNVDLVQETIVVPFR